MCPDAILVRRATRNNLYEYVCQYNDEDTKRTDEIRDHDNNIFTKLREFDPYIVRRIIMFL
eukprot:gene15622-32992_t